MAFFSLILRLREGRYLIIHVSTYYPNKKTHILVVSKKCIVTVTCLITLYGIKSKYTQTQNSLTP